MRLKVIVPPAIEPVTLDEAKTHLRLVDTNAEDAYVAALIVAARGKVELFLRRALVTQTLELTLDRFPAHSRWIDVPRPPLRSVESVKYADTAGIQQTMPAEDYAVDSASNEIGRIAPAPGRYWSVTRSSINSVAIRFIAGYGDAAEDVPQAVRQAILVEISNLYENREDVVAGHSLSMISLSGRLLWPYRALAAE